MFARALLAIVLAGPIVPPALGAGFKSLILSLPRAPAANERVWLSVTAGRLPRGASIRVDKADGSRLELLTVFGANAGSGDVKSTVPLPQSMVVDGHVRVRLTVLGAGAPHAPDRHEIHAVELIYVSVTPDAPR